MEDFLKKEYEDKLDKLIYQQYINDVLYITNSYQNNSYNKRRKFKEIYFLYGTFIYVLNEKNININFFKNDEKVKWVSFQDGPIIKEINDIKIYNFMDIDGKINLNDDIFKNNELNELFCNTFLFLNNFETTEELIEESHKTKPWKDNDWKKKNIKKSQIKK